LKCSVAPTTSTAADAGARDAATNALQAILFREILKPLAAGLGPAGDVAVGSVADSLFARPKP
jgi:hypothetical protein